MHNNIKNNYFLSHSFLGFYDIYLYRFQRQALNEVKQISNFIHSREKHSLKMTRRLFPVLYIPLLLFPATILIGILGILFQPTITYIFNFQQNNLTVIEKSFLISDRKNYLIDKLKIASVDEQKKSILLNTDTEIFYLFDYFQNKQQADIAIDTLKQHLK